MGYKDDLIRARDITASNYRQGKMSPYDDPFNDTYYDQEGWNKELAEAASKDDKIKYEEYLKFFGIDVNSEISSIKIKKAYKEKMKKVHPDKNHGKDTTAETAKVNEIKEFLDMNLEYYLMKRRKNGY